MAKVLKPANDFVIVADAKRDTYIDGIEMPENMKQQEMATGMVVAVGRLVSSETKVKAIVCYGPYAGKTVVIDGMELRLLREGQIEGYIEEAEPNGRLVESIDAGTTSGN